MNKKVQLLAGKQYMTFGGEIEILERVIQFNQPYIRLKRLTTGNIELISEASAYNRIYRYMRHEQKEQGVSPEERMQRIEEKLDMILEILQKGGTP